MAQKVILINSLKLGGAERVIINLINEINDPDIDVLLLENLVEFDINFKIKYLNKYEKKHIFKLIDLFFLGFRLNRYCVKNNIYLVQSHLPRANYVNIISGIFRPKRNIQIVSHGIPSLYKKRGVLGKVNIFLMKNLYNRADTHVVVSNGLKDDFNKVYNSINNFKTIYNPFPIKNILNDSLLEINDFKFSENIFYFIFCGRLNPVKKIDQMIGWFLELYNNHPDVTLIILGDGKEKNKLKTLIQKSQNIHLLGNRVNPFPFLANSSCLLINSDFEGFGNVLVESLICSTPVISADCDYGPREILCLNNKEFNEKGIKYNDYSILYKQNNKQAFFNSLDFMMTNYRNFKKGSTTWKHKESHKFNSENIVLQYKKILDYTKI